MKKLVKRTIKYSLAFLIFLAVILLAAPFFIDINHYKGLILEKTEQATGRKVQMGKLQASFFPWIGVRIDDVKMANRRGFSDEDFLQVKSLDVQVALLPLLSKRIEIKRFILVSPKLLLERDASGVGNWEDLFPAVKKKTPTDMDGIQISATPEGMRTTTVSRGSAPLAMLSAKSLRLLNGAVHYRDARSGSDITLSDFVVNVDGVQLDQPVHVRASGKLSGDDFSVKAEVGPLGDLAILDVARLPLQADIQVKSVALEKLITFIPELTVLGTGALAMDVRLEQRPNGLRVTAGTLALHGEHEADVTWKLEMTKPDRVRLDHVVVRLQGQEAVKMTGSLRGIGRHLQYQLRINTPTLSRERLSEWIPDLQTLYAAHPAPWKQFKLGVLAEGDMNQVALRDMQLILNEELIQVSGNVLFGASPVVRLRVASGNLHLDPWLPQPEKDAARNDMTYGKQAIQLIPIVHAAGARVGQANARSEDISVKTDDMSKEPDLRFLKPWRVTTGLKIGHLFVHGLDLSQLHVSISGKRGVFSVDPFQFELAGGQVSEKVRVNVGRYPVRWSESAKMRGVQVQPVLQALAGTDMLAGVMQVETKLNGVGLLAETAMQSLNGRGNALLRDGMIKGFDIAGTLRNVMTLGVRRGLKQTDFSQLSGSFKIKDGVMSNDDLFMTSPLFRLTGYGQVNLAAKNMDYRVKPRLVGTLVGQGDTEAARKGLVIPLRITGPFDALRVKVEVNIKTLLGNVGNIKGMLKKGGLKSILKGVLQGVPASNPAPATSPAPPQTPAKQAEQILRKLNIPGF